MAPTILIFSIAMGADYSFELISIVHWVPQFIGHNKIFLGRVAWIRIHTLQRAESDIIFTSFYQNN